MTDNTHANQTNGRVAPPAAAPPPTTRKVSSPVLRTLSSVPFGMTVLALILAYASAASAIPYVRLSMEMTEMEIFGHWLFGALIALFALSLSLATWLRIRWTVINAGVLTVHAGLLLLCASAWWYFSTKIEGDAILLTPRVQLMQAGGAALPGGELAARPGESWEQVMPAFGGRVRVEVLDVEREGLQSAARATVRATVGDAAPRDFVLENNAGPVELSGRLNLQLASFGQVASFYDRDAAALYYGPQTGSRKMAALAGLPYFRERYLDADTDPVYDRDEQPVASRRIDPAIEIAGLQIPTGLFEPWRMPIPVTTAGLPFDVTVTGYLPNIAGMRSSVTGGGAEFNPAAEVELSVGQQSIREWLIAQDPVESLLRTAIPFEFRWIEDAAARDALLAPLAGPDELQVIVKDPPVTRTYAVRAGDTIEVAGTPYTLSVRQLQPDWPLMTPGFERSSSPAALVDITSDAKSYNRTVIERYPELSQDIDETGMRRKDGPYDANLVLRYRSAARGKFLLLAGPDAAPELGVFQADGSVERRALAVGAPQPVHVGGFHLDVTLASLITDAQAVELPVVETRERRRPDTFGRSRESAIRLRFDGTGELAGWQASRWVPFSSYPHIDARPIEVTPPGSDATYEFVYSRLERPLGGELGAGHLEVEFHPGRNQVERWHSEFLACGPDGEVREGIVRTNETWSVGRWTLFQSGAAKDHWSFTILGVGNRNGILAQVLGCLMITVGCLYAFYVKPWLRRRQQSAALTAAAARRRPPAVPAVPEPLEVGAPHASN